MTKEELQTELKKVQEAEFLLEMKDYWSCDDYRLSVKYCMQIQNLREQIKKTEEEE